LSPRETKAQPVAMPIRAAVHGIGVSGLASTAYNVAVGGTDFGDSYLNENATYWNATNTATYGSASLTCRRFHGMTPAPARAGYYYGLADKL